MRIVIDLQGAQAENRQRGIGRYSLALAKGIIRNCHVHEVVIALNGALSETIAPLRAEFQKELSHTAIRVWLPVTPARHMESENDSRRTASEKLYEAFLKSLRPDVILITSIFEGLGQDAVTSVGQFSDCPVAAVLYDLIPLINEKPYLENPVVRRWYKEKLSFIRKASHLLSISESSRREAVDYLDFPQDKVTNISTDADPQFIVQEYSSDQVSALFKKYCIDRDLVLYTGGIDHRKNIDSLIVAFAGLPSEIRKEHQLAIVCSISDPDKIRLKELAASQGLESNDLVLTGYVPEVDLIALYNLCKVFVFPSWHEGFGLPALEAMRCGAAVIGANTSSLPEVIGTEEALFDPRDTSEITGKLSQVLTDNCMRERLKNHAERQASCFSWDATAKKAIESLEKLVDSTRIKKKPNGSNLKRRKLAYFSPLPPERSGISDYSSELLKELIKYYDITVVVEQDIISDSWILQNCDVLGHEDFLPVASTFDRVVYHFGNSQFHAYMLPIINKVPGVVVLHDFFLSGLAAYNGGYTDDPLYYLNTLYLDHGFEAINRYFNNDDTAWVYPCNKQPISHAKGVIVHSDFAIDLAEEWLGKAVAEQWTNIPLLRVSGNISLETKRIAREKLGISKGAFIVCSFGMVGKPKLNDRLLEAWRDSILAKNENCFLYFVGQNEPGEFGQLIKDTIEKNDLGDRVKITGWTDADTYIQFLQAADVGVQLRGMTRGETSAAVLDCMNYGLATIVNANGSMKDLPEDSVLRIPDKFSSESLVKALEDLFNDRYLKGQIAKRARAHVLTHHAPPKCGEKYFSMIEKYYKSGVITDSDYISALYKDQDVDLVDSDLKSLAKAIDFSIQPPTTQRQLFVDISELVQRDSKSGIQRVVKNILHEWLDKAPSGYRVEPVYALQGVEGYFYARSFTLDFMEYPSHILKDGLISYRNGDVFLGLDLNHHIPLQQSQFLRNMNDAGVFVSFVIYDILPIQFPEFWESGEHVKEIHEKWLAAVTSYDSVVCISKTVANEVKDWLTLNAKSAERKVSVDWFHLGGDLKQINSAGGLEPLEENFLKRLTGKFTFIMVGTLEPRKGHCEVLDAFEKVWTTGSDAFLVLVGRKGWLMDEFVARLTNHPELGSRLFWFDSASDEFLVSIYQKIDCLIAASYGEGFGLPLVEAAQKGIPVIARDIPVFREVAAPGTQFFIDRDELVNKLKQVLDGALVLKSENDTPAWISWSESVRNLESKLISLE